MEGDAVILTVELGQTAVPLQDLLAYAPSTLVRLQPQADGDAVAVYVDGRRFGSGELLSVDGRLGVRLTEILPGARTAEEEE
jgi:flagellar motor switch/type III secretory pathway protein FliN